MSKILVVDDYGDILEVTSLLFEALGHDTRVATNGREAVDEAAIFDPDIVFLDLSMPILDGFEAAAAIRTAPRGDRPFLIALTGMVAEGTESATRAAGFDFYLQKPVPTNALIALVGNLSTRVRHSGRGAPINSHF